MSDKRGHQMMNRHGFQSTWDPEEKAEIREHHRVLWRQIRRERLGKPNRPVTELEGFVESVQRLYDLGYSQTDISVMFGVSRERTRQWFNRIDGLDDYDDNTGSQFRLWDDEAECFLPVTDDELHTYGQQLSESARRQANDRRRAADIRGLHEAAEELGRPPRVSDPEVIKRIGYPGQHARHWGHPEISYTEAHDRLWAAAGWDPRPDGRAEREFERPDLRKFNDEQAAEMRAVYNSDADVTYEVLADLYECGTHTVWKVLHRKPPYD